MLDFSKTNKFQVGCLDRILINYNPTRLDVDHNAKLWLTIRNTYSTYKDTYNTYSFVFTFNAWNWIT